MSQDLDPGGEDRDLLAGEYALGLLAGAERAAAEKLLADDPDFRDRVAFWTGRFAPLLDETAPATPRPAVWAGIEQRIAALAGSGEPEIGGSNIYVLRRRVSMWRGLSVGASAIAASLALFVMMQAPPPAPPATPVPIAAAPLVAVMEAESSAAKLVATFDPASGSLIVTPAAGIHAVPGRGHELWLIPADGKPRAMAMVKPGAPLRMTVPAAMLVHMKADVTLALSVEPAGGSRTGLPTGPVIAAGKLLRT